MVNSCCVLNCRHRTHERRNGVRFFHFPTWKQGYGPQVSELSKRRRMAWIAAVRLKHISFNNIPRHMVVCSRHFHKGKPAYEMLECDPDWAPSLHLGHSEVKATKPSRFERRKKRQQTLKKKNTAPEPKQEPTPIPIHPVQKTEPDESPPLDDIPPLDEIPPPDETPPQDDTSQTPMIDVSTLLEQDECSFCVCRRAEINRLLEENRRLKKELAQKTMDEDFFKEDDSKVRFYTGLPSFAVLMGILDQIFPTLQQNNRKLSPFQMLILTLMRLKLNLPDQLFAHIFSVGRKTASSIFKETASMMYVRLNPLVVWPERPCLQTIMPQQFIETFGSHVAFIVDSIEIDIDRVSNGKPKAQMVPQNKKTLKYLICSIPRGAITFISKPRESQVDDKSLIESSGLLKKIQSGDLVLSECGFDIRDGVGLTCAEVDKGQLKVRDVETTRQISNLRLHVKRVTACVRTKYTFLNGPVLVSMTVPDVGEDITFLDKIVTVCCALTNMCPSVVMKP